MQLRLFGERFPHYKTRGQGGSDAFNFWRHIGTVAEPEPHVNDILV